MTKKSILLICISIIIGFTISGALVCYGLLNTQGAEETPRYEMVSHGDNIIIFDRYTGDYWNKYLPQNQGPTDWEISDSPVN